MMMITRFILNLLSNLNANLKNKGTIFLKNNIIFVFLLIVVVFFFMIHRNYKARTYRHNFLIKTKFTTNYHRDKIIWRYIVPIHL